MTLKRTDELPLMERPCDVCGAGPEFKGMRKQTPAVAWVLAIVLVVIGWLVSWWVLVLMLAVPLIGDRRIVRCSKCKASTTVG